MGLWYNAMLCAVQILGRVNVVSKRSYRKTTVSQRIVWGLSMMIVISMVISLFIVAIPGPPAPTPTPLPTWTTRPTWTPRALSSDTPLAENTEQALPQPSSTSPLTVTLTIAPPPLEPTEPAAGPEIPPTPTSPVTPTSGGLDRTRLVADVVFLSPSHDSRVVVPCLNGLG